MEKYMMTKELRHKYMDPRYEIPSMQKIIVEMECRQCGGEGQEDFLYGGKPQTIFCTDCDGAGVVYIDEAAQIVRVTP